MRAPPPPPEIQRSARYGARNWCTSARSTRWLTLVALAPVAGVLVGAILQVPDAVLGAMLGFFAGFFLYVGAAELLPEAHRRDRRRLVALATILGAVAVYAFSVAVGAIGVDAH